MLKNPKQFPGGFFKFSSFFVGGELGISYTCIFGKFIASIQIFIALMELCLCSDVKEVIPGNFLYNYWARKIMSV